MPSLHMPRVRRLNLRVFKAGKPKQDVVAAPANFNSNKLSPLILPEEPNIYEEKTAILTHELGDKNAFTLPDSTAADKALAATESVLRLLAAIGSSTPGLKEISNLAISVLKAVQDSRSNQEDLEEIVRQICISTLGIQSLISQESKPGQDPAAHKFLGLIKDFTRHLTEIQNMCIEMASQPNDFKKAIYAERNKKNIERIRRELKLSYDLFAVNNAILLRQSLEAWNSNNQDQMLEVLSKLEHIEESTANAKNTANTGTGSVSVAQNFNNRGGKINQIGSNFKKDELPMSGGGSVTIGSDFNSENGNIGQIGSNFGYNQTFNPNTTYRATTYNGTGNTGDGNTFIGGNSISNNAIHGGRTRVRY